MEIILDEMAAKQQVDGFFSKIIVSILSVIIVLSLIGLYYDLPVRPVVLCSIGGFTGHGIYRILTRKPSHLFVLGYLSICILLILIVIGYVEYAHKMSDNAYVGLLLAAICWFIIEVCIGEFNKSDKVE